MPPGRFLSRDPGAAVARDGETPAPEKWVALVCLDAVVPAARGSVVLVFPVGEVPSAMGAGREAAAHQLVVGLGVRIAHPSSVLDQAVAIVPLSRNRTQVVVGVRPLFHLEGVEVEAAKPAHP